MTVSETIGGLPILSRVFDHGPAFAGLTIFVMLFGLTYPLLCLHWGRFLRLRRLYTNLSINDGIVYPVYMTITAYVLANDPIIYDFLKSPLWHWGVLVAGIALSPALCWWEVRTKKYTLETQFLPWKIYHTIVLPIAFYWIVSTAPLMLFQWKLLPTGTVVVGFTIFVLTHIVDGWLPYMDRARRFFLT